MRARDARARRKANAQRMAFWLLGHLDFDTPVFERALFGGDLAAVEELRAALVAAAPLPEPELVVFQVLRRQQRGQAAA